MSDGEKPGDEERGLDGTQLVSEEEAAAMAEGLGAADAAEDDAPGEGLDGTQMVTEEEAAAMAEARAEAPPSDGGSDLEATKAIDQVDASEFEATKAIDQVDASELEATKAIDQVDASELDATTVVPEQAPASKKRGLPAAKGKKKKKKKSKSGAVAKTVDEKMSGTGTVKATPVGVPTDTQAARAKNAATVERGPAQDDDVAARLATTQMSTRRKKKRKQQRTLYMVLLAVVGASVGFIMAQRKKKARRRARLAQLAQQQNQTPPPAPAPPPAPVAAPKPTVAPVETPPASATTTPAPSPASASASASASAAPPAPPAPAVRKRAADLAACVNATFPEGGFEAKPGAFDFVCEETLANKAVPKMLAIATAAKKKSGAARSEWARLGWYQVARLQQARTRCCGPVGAFEEVPALSACKMGEALTALDEAKDEAGRTEATKSYARAINCIFKAQAASLFGQWRAPSSGQHTLFMTGLERTP